MSSPAEFHRLVASLESIPAEPRSLSGPSNWLNGILLLADYLASVPPRMSRWTSPLRKYPKDFEKVRFPSADGTRLVGWLGRSGAPGPRPGLVLLPGLFTSKDNNRIRARSVRILREWGFHILTLDLRGIGESERRYSTPGIKEAEDITAAVDWLRATVDARPVHLYTESLAASAALVAVGLAGRAGKPLVDGRILAVSPYGDPRLIVERFGGRVDWSDRAFGPAKAFFKFVLRLSGTGDRDFRTYVENAAKSYGMEFDMLLDASTARTQLPHARSATLVLHSIDDMLVPIDDARRLEASVNGNPWVRFRILPWGNHCLYEMADPTWYWETLRRYFGAGPTA